MKRLLLVLPFLVATGALGADKWPDAYSRGIAAVNAKRYADAIPALQAAIAGNPKEGTEVKAGLTIIGSYIPHFWLGIARFHTGDIDGALREWRVSEEQGAVARTPYYAQLKSWVQRGELEKQRVAESAAAGAKKAADAAVRRAVQAQGDAVTSGGDRTESYREAQRRLQDALARFRAAGTNVAAYESVAQTADQAAQGFIAAAEEGKRVRAAQAARPKPVLPVEQPTPVVPDPVPARTETVFVIPAPASTTTGGAATAPAADDRRRTGASSTVVVPPVPIPATTTTTATTAVTTTAPPAAAPAPRPDVTPAYRAFAMGDLVSAERLLTNMLSKTPSAEAYLLRGCVRYTRAMLSRTPGPLLLESTNDFKAALARNRALRLDPTVFSPKLVARFEQVRNGR